MPFDFQQFITDRKIDVAPRGHQHSRRNWINIECPFCRGHKGFHLGFSIKQSSFTCYRCGYHKIYEVCEALTGIRNTEFDNKLTKLLKPYWIKSASEIDYQKTKRPRNITMPEPLLPLTNLHKQYLESRQFDPDLLQYKWDLKGTNHIGNLNIDNELIDYKWRIIAPIEFQNEVVSFQGRDITDKQIAKYKACDERAEVIPHKQVLYGLDMAQGKGCIVVEGITGVWRLGPGAVATFGANYSSSQLQLLSRFDFIHTFFDPDNAGIIAADNMQGELSALGKEVIVWELDKDQGLDSGNISQKYADELMKEALK